MATRHVRTKSMESHEFEIEIERELRELADEQNAKDETQKEKNDTKPKTEPIKEQKEPTLVQATEPSPQPAKGTDFDQFL